MEAQRLSECNQCGKKFQRKAHLLRHQQQHSGDRPYVCKFCSKTFKRSDVLRDHFSRCEQRGDSAIPSSLERGRKRHACDECSRLKVKCDNEVPCRKCREFGRTCVKTRPPAVAAAATPDSHDVTHDNTTSSSTTTTTTSPDTVGSDRNSIGFLLNCPKESDFMFRFPMSVTMSPSTRVSTLGEGLPGSNGFPTMPNSMNPATVNNMEYFGSTGMEGNVDLLLSGLEFESFERRNISWSRIQMPGIFWTEQDALYTHRSVLEQRALDIRHNLYRTAAALVGPNLPPKELAEAIELLSAEKIAIFIKLYFRHWHKHGPIVHEPSFNPCVAAIPLVLALMALGAMYSKDPQEVIKIKILLDTIETYIYSLPGLSEEYDHPGRQYAKLKDGATPEWQQYQLEEMQGAYLMIVLQYWTGTATARKRVRQARFTRIIEIYRYLGMNNVQHPADFKITDEQSFKTWTLKEAYIRTATIAMMLDNAFGIFNNITPRLQWSEIDLPFPSEDRYFEFASYEELLADSRFPYPKPKIKDAFMMLISAGDNWKDELRCLRLGTLNAMDMQMLMHMIYTYFWTHTFASPFATLPTMSMASLLLPFKSVMTNWKNIWDEIKASMAVDEWNTLGFRRTAEIYYDAVKAIIQIFERREGRFPDIPSDCEKGSHLRLLLSF